MSQSTPVCTLGIKVGGETFIFKFDRSQYGVTRLCQALIDTANSFPQFGQREAVALLRSVRQYFALDICQGK